MKRFLAFLLAIWAILTVFDTTNVGGRAAFVASLMRKGAPASLPVPVHGVAAAAIADTWGAPRSGGRVHHGVDIFARRGTPVRSPVDGLVVRVGQDRLGGNVVSILGPGLHVHYLAHLESFGPFAVGDVVRTGDIVGFVGDTGNARGTPPHLHYGIYAGARGALNPYPLLKADPRSRSPEPHSPTADRQPHHRARQLVPRRGPRAIEQAKIRAPACAHTPRISTW